ncbi:MAG: hypothetical protein LIO75_07220 [Lachnospiraceae bacterium]|nr:hypothetical protein [Lachnospiraceae bacterium]
MTESELRDGLKRLGDFLRKVDIDSELLERSPEIPMDSLHIPLEMEELTLDLVCNYIDESETDGMLQFYAQIELDDNPLFSASMPEEAELLRLCNGLNTIMPIGQTIYMHKSEEEGITHALGLRYTMLTDLSGETEFGRCVENISMLMTIYQFLCGALLLLADGNDAAEAIDQISELL